MSHPVEDASKASRLQFGFWLYLMTDCILFASLFAVYAVLRVNTNGGPSGAEIFNLPFVLVETFILLTSSFTCGMAMLAVQQRERSLTLLLLSLTGLLGVLFIGMELFEFHKLVVDGDSWRRSGFLSAYFALVATHGLHILAGLLWLAVMMIRIARRGFGTITARRINAFSMFWHFLDVVWIFIFSVMYLWSGRL